MTHSILEMLTHLKIRNLSQSVTGWLPERLDRFQKVILDHAIYQEDSSDEINGRNVSECKVAELEHKNVNLISANKKKRLVVNMIS